MKPRLQILRCVKPFGAFALGAVASVLFAAQAFAADIVDVRLKANISVEGSDIRLGDLFDGAGDAAMAVFGMAPGPGRSMSYSASYVQAKAKQAGLKWDNAEKLATVVIKRGDGGASQTAEQQSADDPFTPRAQSVAASQSSNANADLKRGDPVQIVYRAPGVQLLASGKAISNASIGGKARAVNTRSNKAVDGILVSPGRIEAFSLSAPSNAQTAYLEPNQ